MLFRCFEISFHDDNTDVSEHEHFNQIGFIKALFGQPVWLVLLSTIYSLMIMLKFQN